MHRLALARALVAEGVDLHVAIPFDSGDSRFSNTAFELHRLSLRRGSKNPLQEAKTLFELAAVSRRVRPALVHHVTIKPVLYGSVVARTCGTPAIVNSITGLGYVFSSSNADARLLKSLMLPVMRYGCDRRNVTMLFENNDDLELYCSLRIADKSRSHVIPSSGIDPAAFTPHRHTAGAVTVMLLSRMLWDKGVKEFVDAARVVKSTRPLTRFVLVGATDPNPESIPGDTLRQWNEEGIVEYWGWRSDVPVTLQSADILCLPSYREGLPRSLLEGAAAGLALLTTDVPGCRDVVRANLSGLIVPARNVEALARAMLELVDNVEMRGALGSAARADVIARFSVESVINQTCAAYRDTLNRAL